MKKFKIYLTAVGAMFGKKVTPDLVAGYLMALEDYAEADLLRVGKKLAQGQYFPRPYDFIQAIEGQGPKPEDLADLRWQEIVAYIWDKGKFPEDATAIRVFHMMGDRYYFKQMTEKQLTGAGFSFRKSYCASVVIQDAADKELLIEGAAQPMIGGVADMVTMDGRQDK